eukprot:gene3582-4462_t
MPLFPDIPKLDDDCEGGNNHNNQLKLDTVIQDHYLFQSSLYVVYFLAPLLRKEFQLTYFINFLGIAVTSAAASFAHAITYAITLAILTNLAQYHLWKCKQRRSDLGHWHQYGPFYLTVIAIPLATFDILRHILVDNGLWTANSRYPPNEYRPGCTSGNIRCLSVLGVFSAIIFTYSGYILLMIGTIWCAGIHTKMIKLWQKLRPNKKY